MEASNLEFCDSHNMIAFLKKPKTSNGFHEIIDFLTNSSIHYALTINPRVYIVHINEFWNSASYEESNGIKKIKAKIDNKEVIITENIIRTHLHLQDEAGISSIPSTDLFALFERMGYEGNLTKFTFQKALLSPQWKFLVHIVQQCLAPKRSTWNEFNKSIATVVACLTSGQVYNFSQMIFEGMLGNLTNPDGKFLMYPRFLQQIFLKELTGLTDHAQIYLSPLHSQKIFANMKRQCKGFSGAVTPLFPNMLGVTIPTGEETSNPLGSQPTPVLIQQQTAATVETAQPETQSTNNETVASQVENSQPSSLHVTKTYTRKQKRIPSTSVATNPKPKSLNTPKQITIEVSEIPKVTLGTSELSPKLMKVVMQKGIDHEGRAQTTVVTPSVAQDSLTGNKTQLSATLSDESFDLALEGPRCQETMGGTSAEARPLSVPGYPSNDQPLAGTQQLGGEDSSETINLKELMDLLVTLKDQVTLQSDEIVTLKEKVHKLELTLKKQRFQVLRTKKKAASKRLKKKRTSQVIISSQST